MIPDLDALGILHGTDKSSLNHDYLRHYERILGPRRAEPLTLLEIGVFRGGSLATWEAFLPQAKIVGLDIKPDCMRYAGGRREVEIGSQADPAFLRQVMHRHRPDVVIDDGSHLADHVILTFETLYPMLPPGGIYIVEDIQFHAGPGAGRWRNGADAAPQDVLLRLARLVSCPGTPGDEQRRLAHMTDAVEFFYGAVAITRRPTKKRAEVEARRAVVEQANRPKTWATFAVHLYNNTKDLADARAAVQRAIDAEPTNSEHWDFLSVILEQAADIPGSLEAAQQASAMNKGDQRLANRVVSLKSRLPV